MECHMSSSEITSCHSNCALERLKSEFILRYHRILNPSFLHVCRRSFDPVRLLFFCSDFERHLLALSFLQFRIQYASIGMSKVGIVLDDLTNPTYRQRFYTMIMLSLSLWKSNTFGDNDFVHLHSFIFSVDMH